MAHLLYPHNEIAYQSASSMMAETGKAAVIHPTGTGKSFIGFQLCADHQDKRVCWLSPSEYIYETQRENWRDAGGADQENIEFFTYARLMLMEEAELSKVQPDYIILDEFHRCGAEMWGKGVERLLHMYPSVPLLGLTATNIRYLDNQRDMADELFDGNIASQMSLGEAIVQGILSPPRYILAMYSYDKDLERLRRKIRTARNKAVQETAKDYFEKLRRALANAEGLDEIFARHMTDPNGKYLVFCSNAEHMDEMIDKVPEWFSKVDPTPHVYRAYSDDPTTSKAFAAFKEDDSNHLKLLFCINMLNEGIHVDDVSGVILLRPTVSPIIYKQQIGRALSAGKKKQPLILDIVANVSNLYTVDVLRNEITEIVQLYRERGEGKQVSSGEFTLIDEVEDCRKLFAQLDETLTSSWEEMYRQLSRFKEQNGHVNVPAHYKTPDGFSLGNWCTCQRRVYRGAIRGILTEDRIHRLNALGFQWAPLEDHWLENYLSAETYFREHGHLEVPHSYVTDKGVKLGVWIAINRSAFAKRKLPEEKIRMLQNIGMIWNVSDYRWEKNYMLCREYYLKHGERIPSKYVAEDGSRPGQWLSRVVLRHIRQDDTQGAALRDDQVELLKEIGVVFERHADLAWEASFAEAETYYRVHGNLDVPGTYMTGNGLRLRSWLDYQRQSGAGLNHSPMTPERRAKLDSLRFDWKLRAKREDSWPKCFQRLTTFVRAHDGKCPPQKYVEPDGLRLGSWLSNQKRKYRNGSLDLERERLLRSIGVVFEDTNEKHWMEGYRHAVAYGKIYHTMAVPVLYQTEDGFPLGEWLRTQVKAQVAGKLKEERKARLDQLGVRWKDAAPLQERRARDTKSGNAQERSAISG